MSLFCLKNPNGSPFSLEKYSIFYVDLEDVWHDVTSVALCRPFIKPSHLAPYALVTFHCWQFHELIVHFIFLHFSIFFIFRSTVLSTTAMQIIDS